MAVGGQPGNTNSKRANRLWADTIRRALAQGDGNKLRAIAERLIDKAAEGDMQAIKELGDRLDGKAAQQVVFGDGGDDDAPVGTFRIEVIGAHADNQRN
jgi:hypothetical protein